MTALPIDLANFMDMGGSSGHAGHGGQAQCKISMLWNWYSIDACFLSRNWHVRTKAQFAGTIIGIFMICVLLEALRRGAREYDRKITVMNRRDHKGGYIQPTWGQHIVRTLAYGTQFTGAFLVMLLGMYFNVPVLMAIFFGHTFGYLAFGRDTCGDALVESGCAC